MAHQVPAGGIDLSRHVTRLWLLRLIDYGLVYGSVHALLAVAVGLLRLKPDLPDLFIAPVAAWCLYVGMRNIGTAASRKWRPYLAIFGIGSIAGLMWAAVAALALAAPETGAGNVAEVAIIGIVTGGWIAIWCAIGLCVIAGLRSMKIPGIGVDLGGLGQTMADDGREASEPVDFSRVQRVNKNKGLVCGALGIAVLLASAYVSTTQYEKLSTGTQTSSNGSTQQRSVNAIECLGFFLLVRMRRYFQIDADALLRVDSRRPILFLRSFEDDEKISYADSGKALFDYSLETRLSRHFMHFGPFVAIGSPKEELPVPGAARMRLSDEEWQGQVRRWMRDSQVILMYCGSTYWVNWELAMLARKGYLGKVILLFPPRRGWVRRSRKIADDMKLRLTCVKGALQDTPWAQATAALAPDPTLRALAFDGDGTLTPIYSRREDREAFHLSVLVGHYLLSRRPAAQTFQLRAISQPAQQWPLRSGVTRIGKDRGNDIALSNDAFVSAEHARIECSGGRIVIVDLGSRNGTYVNGDALHGTTHALRRGDLIRIGHSDFELAA